MNTLIKLIILSLILILSLNFLSPNFVSAKEFNGDNSVLKTLHMCETEEDYNGELYLIKPQYLKKYGSKVFGYKHQVRSYSNITNTSKIEFNDSDNQGNILAKCKYTLLRLNNSDVLSKVSSLITIVSPRFTFKQFNLGAKWNNKEIIIDGRSF